MQETSQEVYNSLKECEVQSSVQDGEALSRITILFNKAKDVLIGHRVFFGSVLEAAGITKNDAETALQTHSSV